MSKGLKTIIGVVAAVAIPFVAPVIAGAIGASALLGTTAASALTGAALGAGTAAVTGRNPLLGAALGGVGGFAGGGGLSGLFGTGAAGLGGEAGVPLAEAPAYNVATMGRAAAEAAGQIPAAAAPAAGGIATAAPAAAGGVSLGSLGSSLASAINPSNLAQLAAVMYNVSNYSQLDDARQAALKETAELAATNRGLFEQRVNAARSLMQQAEANPQQAFATTEMRVQRQLRDQTGNAPGAERKAAIEGTRLGVLAAEREGERARGAMASALQALPTAAPQGAAAGLYNIMAADLNARGQLASQGANLITRMFPNELDLERERRARTAGLFRFA